MSQAQTDLALALCDALRDRGITPTDAMILAACKMAGEVLALKGGQETLNAVA